MTGHEVFELPLDIAQQAGSAEAEKIGLEPSVAQFLLHQGQVDKRILGLGNTTCGFVSHPEPGPLVVVADLTDHGKAYRECCIDALLAG